MDKKFHGISHGSEFHKFHNGAGDDAHIKEVLSERSLTTNNFNTDTIAYSNICKRGHMVMKGGGDGLLIIRM